MLCYDIIEISEETYVNVISASKGCDICDYWHFVNYSFQFLKKAILNIKRSDYSCIISLISKNEAIIYCKMLIC